MMKKLLLAAFLAFVPASAWAQCSGVFPPNTLCGNLSGTAAPPKPFVASTTIVGPGSSVVGHFATWANTFGTLLADFDLFGAANIWANTNGFNGAVTFGSTATFNGTANFTNTFQLGGVTFALTDITVTNHAIVAGKGTPGFSAVGPGTLGQALVSNGASADPAFKSGGWTLLNTLTASTSASLSDTTSLTSSYSEYEIEFTDILPATNGVTGQLRINSAGVQTTGYIANTIVFANGSATGTAAAPTTFIPVYSATGVLNTGNGLSGKMYINNPSSSGITHIVYGNMFQRSAALSGWCGCSGAWNTAGAITGIEFTFSSGNIASGSIKIYGRL